MTMPDCDFCRSNADVEIAEYPDGASFYECTKCFNVIAPIVDTAS